MLLKAGVYMPDETELKQRLACGSMAIRKRLKRPRAQVQSERQ